MKLYQALKYKNKLAGEIKELEQLIQGKNSRLKTEENLFNIDELLSKLISKREELLDLKTRLYQANQPIQGLIFKLAEAKSQHAFWSRLPTKQGMGQIGYSNELTEYVAHFNELHTLSEKEKAQKEIESIQEKLDYFNHTTELV